MKKRAASPLVVIFLLVFFLALVQAEILAFQEDSFPQEKQEDRVEGEIETIVPAPKDITEATAIYIFLGWIWLSIGILIFLLRLKIKEVDRLHELGYFTEKKD